MNGQVRRRVNVSRSTKGVITFDCTVEVTDNEDKAFTNEDVMLQSNNLVFMLQEKYPNTEV